MAQLTVTTFNRAGVDLSATAVAAAAGGDKFTNNGLTFLYIENAGVSSITLTLVSQATLDGQAPPNRTITVTAGQRQLIGPFPVTAYNDANGNMNLTYSGVTSVKVLPLILGT